MAQLTLYKSVYLVKSGTDYEPITPYGISASTYDENGITLFEKITSEIYKLGVYSANVNADLYSAGLVYQIKWYIQYTSDSPVVSITDYFQAALNANFSNQIFIQVQQNPIIIPV